MPVETFTATEFQAALPSGWRCVGYEQGELTYRLPTVGEVEIVVRSSIRMNGASADVGEDSIRAWLVASASGAPISHKVNQHTTRISGWQGRLAKVIQTLTQWRRVAGDCPKCQRPKGIYQSQTSKNPGRMFAKCGQCEYTFEWLDNPRSQPYYAPTTAKVIAVTNSEDKPENDPNNKRLLESLSSELGTGVTPSPSNGLASGTTVDVSPVLSLDREGNPAEPRPAVPDEIEQAPVVASPVSFLSKRAAVRLTQDESESDLTAATSNKGEFVPSRYQEAIYEFLKAGSGNGVVIATAGSGKTSTIRHATPYLPRGAKIAAIAFNRRNALDLQRVMPDTVRASTFHSLGLSNVKRAYKNIKVDADKTWHIIRDMGWTIGRSNPEVEMAIETDGAAIHQIVGLAKNILSGTTPDDIDCLCEHYGISLESHIETVSEIVSTVLNISNDDTYTADFDDMLWWCATGKVPCEQFDFLLIDELQDTNQAQIEFIKRSLRPGARVIGVGDPRQCHPPGTIISMTGNSPKTIENINVGEQVVSYYTQKSVFKGVNSQGRKILSKDIRPYTGRMLTLRVGAHSVDVTPNHKCLVRLNDREGYALYLMVRSGYARIGVTKLKHGGSGVSGLSQRARTEGAEKLWLLDIYQTRDEAQLSELLAQSRFGIPSLIFNSTYQGTNATQDFIDSFYSRLGSNLDRAYKCLNSFGREFDYPIWEDKPEYNTGWGVNKSFITQACNIISGRMRMCTYGGNLRSAEWETAIVSGYDYSGMIYGIEVEPTEGGKRLYVANGIVVHNSIYSFRGAAPDAMEQVIAHTEASTLPLSITYRLPLSHVEYVNRRFPDVKMEARLDAPEGEIKSLGYSEMISKAQSGDLVICRVNAPLVEPCFELIRQGRKATIAGRDIGKGLTVLLTKMEKKHPGSSLTQLLSALRDYAEREIGKLLAARKGNQAGTLSDQVETLLALSDGAHTTGDIRRKVEAVFSDDAKGVIFSSGHRAKGSEADRVYYFHPELVPHRLATEPWQLLAESNIDFVMSTRSKHGLYFTNGN